MERALLMVGLVFIIAFFPSSKKEFDSGGRITRDQLDYWLNPQDLWYNKLESNGS